MYYRRPHNYVELDPVELVKQFTIYQPRNYHIPSLKNKDLIFRVRIVWGRATALSDHTKRK